MKKRQISIWNGGKLNEDLVKREDDLKICRLDNMCGCVKPLCVNCWYRWVRHGNLNTEVKYLFFPVPKRLTFGASNGFLGKIREMNNKEIRFFVSHFYPQMQILTEISDFTKAKRSSDTLTPQIFHFGSSGLLPVLPTILMSEVSLAKQEQ